MNSVRRTTGHVRVTMRGVEWEIATQQDVKRIWSEYFKGMVNTLDTRKTDVGCSGIWCEIVLANEMETRKEVVKAFHKMNMYRVKCVWDYT